MSACTSTTTGVSLDAAVEVDAAGVGHVAAAVLCVAPAVSVDGTNESERQKVVFQLDLLLHKGPSFS